MEAYMPVLERTALFAGLTRGEIAALCRAFHCRTAYYPKGSVLLRRGERVSSAGIVLSGAVQAERNGADGELRVVARHGAGALFGDVLTASQGRKCPVDIVATEETNVLFVPLAALMGEDVPSCREAQIRARLNMLLGLSEKYWTLSRRLDLLSAPTLRAKLARRLLAERRERGSDGFTLPGTRETLASELGVNRSALSRELGGLVRAGVLEARRGSFTLLDVPALERMADV